MKHIDYYYIAPDQIAGDMVEIKYLYAYKGGSLYQPQYLGIRDDKDTPDKESQLKFKK